MKIEAVCSNPNDVEFTIVMTATLKEWNMLKETMDLHCYSELKSNLDRQIREIVSQFANAKYMPKMEETGDA